MPHMKGSILLGFSASLPACWLIASPSLRFRVLSLWVLMHILSCNGGALVLFVYAGSRFDLPLNLHGPVAAIACLVGEDCAIIFLGLSFSISTIFCYISPFWLGASCVARLSDSKACVLPIRSSVYAISEPYLSCLRRLWRYMSALE